MEPLNDLEHAVLKTILEGDDRSLVALRGQLAIVSVRQREFSGVGFFTHLALPPATPPAHMTARVPGLDDVTVEIEGLRHGAGFVLFLGDGLLDMLEGYSYGEPWPSRVGRFSLQRHPRASLPLP